MTPAPDPLDTTPPGPSSAQAGAALSHDALPPGARIDEFEIVRVLGAGGFGIVYLAFDQVLLRQVAIKEYMPSALAGRGTASQVMVRSSANARTFEMGLESFINEARLLASFDHPSLVKVHRFSKANGTAYMVMQYYPGQTLKEVRLAMGEAPDEYWLRALLDPLLGALEVLHAEGVYHRDIAPDNILMLPDGRPVVLDFGSARRVIGDRTQSLTAILKPNFAPVEQYADEAGMRQGPYTDIFALGATLHFMLTGHAPTPAVMRAVRDSMPLLAAPESVARPGLSTEFLAAVDWTLALAPQERPQSVAELRAALLGAIIPPTPQPRHQALARFESPDFRASDALAKTEAFPRTALDPQRRATTRPRANVTGAPMPDAAARPPKRVAAWSAALATVATLSLGAWALTQGAGTSAAPVDTLRVAQAAPAPAAPATVIAASAPVAVPMAAPVPMPAPEPVPVPVATTRTEAAAVSAPAAATANSRSAASRATVVMAGNDAPKRAPSESSGRRATPASVAPVVAMAAAPVAAVVAAPVAAPAAEPTPLCGGRGFFATNICLSRVCEAPALRSHPQCIESRRLDELRQRAMDR